MWTTTKRCLLRCIATLCVATVFLVRAEDADAPFATQLAKLIAADGAANDNFGHSVAISDGIAVVGAYGDEDKGSYSGSAYVFEMSDSSDATSWTQVAKLTADDGAAYDNFGASVAISDGTIVVGAYNDDDKGSNSGSAYVFEKSDSSDATSWTQVVKLTAKDGAANDKFGFPLLLATVPSSSEHMGTTIKGQLLVPRTSSRRAILPTRPRGRKRRNSPPTTEQ